MPLRCGAVGDFETFALQLTAGIQYRFVFGFYW